MTSRIGFKFISIFAFGFFVFSGCTKKAAPARITIQLPQTGSMSASSKIGAFTATPTPTPNPHGGSADWTDEVPTSVNEIGCYAIFVGGPASESKLNQSTCKAVDGTPLMSFGPHVGMVSAGQSISLDDIPSGSNRVIYVVGLKLLNGSCENNMPLSHDFTFSNYSYPYVLGWQALDINPGDNTATIPIGAQFDSSHKLGDCSFFKPSSATPSPSPSPTPSPTPAYFNVKQVALGVRHSCALNFNGKVKCWGDATYGQLGNGSTAAVGTSPGHMGAALNPSSLGTGFNANSIAAGDNATCAINTSGQLKCWGQNTYGELGLETTTTMGLSPGTSGDSLPYVNLGTGITAVKVAIGADHACAITDSGNVKCWGKGVYGQLGLGTTTSYGNAPTTMGDNLPTVPLGGATAVDVATASSSSCVVLSDQTVKCWGSGTSGQLGNGSVSNVLSPSAVTGLSGVVRLSASANGYCALTSGNTMYCWGDNQFGQLGIGSGTTYFATPQLVSAGVLWADLGSGGGQHICGVLSGINVVACAGSNAYGQLGFEHTTNVNAVAHVVGDPVAANVYTSRGTSEGHTCARLGNGLLKCWGNNVYGQLGVGSTVGYGATAGDMAIVPVLNLGSD